MVEKECNWLYLEGFLDSKILYLLSDREDSKGIILIGQRSLKNYYIVDRNDFLF
ncbi:MAG: hypothetical protein ACI37V_02055 [Methanobrevibacter sp.]